MAFLSMTNPFVSQPKSEFGFTETAPLVKGLILAWFVLLIPWLPFAALAGMASDGGVPLTAYVFVGAIWSYPISLWIAFVARRKMPVLVLLPLLNVAAFCLVGS
jgi:hypothetical protein